jgi:hypothetical protein
MDKKQIAAAAIGSFIGTAAFTTAITAVTIVTKKIDRARRTKREENHNKTANN